MKKTAYILAAIITAAASVFTSCQKQDPDELEIIPDSTVMSSFGGNINVTIKANNPTTISCDASWLKIGTTTWTPTEEKKQTSIMLYASRNEEDEVKNATVTFVAGSLTKTVSFSQTEAGRIIAEEASEYNVECGSGELTVNISTNLDCEVFTSSDWIRRAETKALAKRGFNFVFDKNTDIDPRSAILQFYFKDVREKVTVIQAGDFSKLTWEVEGDCSNIPVFGNEIHLGRLEWGDGEKTSYSPDASHSYSDQKESHSVTAIVEPSTKVTFNGFSGITKIDFSEL